MRADHAERDGEQVRAEWAVEVQLGPVPQQDEKNFVGEILDFPRAGAEPLQSFEKVVELPLIDGDAGCLALGLGRGVLDLP